MKLICILLSLGLTLQGGVALLVFCKRLRSEFCPHLLLIAASGMYYGAGTFATYIINTSKQVDGLNREMAVTDNDNAYALCLVIAFCFILNLCCAQCGRYTSIRTDEIRRKLAEFENQKSFMLCVGGVFLVQVVLILTGGLGYSGVQSGSNNATTASPIAIAIQPLAYTVMFVCGYCVTKPRARAMAAITLVLQIAILFLAGRRVVVVASVITVIGMLVAGMQSKKLIVMSSAAIPVCVLAFYSFYALRLAGWTIGKEASLVDRIKVAAEIVVFDPSKLNEDLEENVQSRPFILRYLSLLASRPRDITPTLGRANGLEMLSAIPSALFPKKEALINYGGAEEVAWEAFNLPTRRGTDMPTTLITTWYTDFREFGLILAAGFVVLWIALLKRMFAKCQSRFFCVAIVSGCAFTSLYLEDSTVRWYLTAREAAIYVVAAYVITSVQRRWA